MNEFSRRHFLGRVGAAAATLLAARNRSSAQILTRDRPFEMLVVGDSHMSGQGLREENKFYYLYVE